MESAVDHANLHRTAKYFMDNGRADSPEAAVELLHKFGLTIHVGEEVAHSPDHQTALLTLVNTACRTLLGGVEVIGLPDIKSTARIALGRPLGRIVQDLGGKITGKARPDWPRAVIGTARNADESAAAWRLTWEGWRGGVIPLREGERLAEKAAMPIAPTLAAAACAAEAFAYHTGDDAMSGRRSSGLSLWNPGTDWRRADSTEPLLAYLPSRLWIIGLGNLGQAYAWLLGCLPYPANFRGMLVLQDFDRVSAANESTSLLTSSRDINHRKTRLVANWLEGRGFDTIIEERRFGQWTRRATEEPGAALCGVDNALARLSLEKAGFDLVVEAGLGAGPQGFRNTSMHTLPASRTAEDIWSGNAGTPDDVRNMPAYQSLQQRGMDRCGLAQLASRTVAVPFVSLVAACLVVSEILRRLHSGLAIEVASLSIATMEDIEVVTMKAPAYACGHVQVSGIGM